MNDVLSESEVAVILDCEPITVQEKARLGELPGLKFGRSWVFPRTALLEVLHTKAIANKPSIAKIRAVAFKAPHRAPPPSLPMLS